jgi:hypothetical protein
MKRPPILMRVQVGGEERKFRLWLPLFLLVPLALLLLIILSPLILVAIVIVRVTGRGRRLWPVARTSLGILCSVRGIRAAFDVLCSMPGLRIDVCNSKERVHVSII